MEILKTKFIDMLQGDGKNEGLNKNPRKLLRKNYKEWIKKQTCLITNLQSPDLHHIRNINTLSGTGTKPTDEYIVPLCHELHQEFHLIGVKSFQKKYSIDMLKELEKLHDKFIEIMKQSEYE